MHSIEKKKTFKRNRTTFRLIENNLKQAQIFTELIKYKTECRLQTELNL